MIVALALRLADTLKGRATAAAEISKRPMASIRDGAHPKV